jgi:membrane protein involved in colicin uptake
VEATTVRKKDRLIRLIKADPRGPTGSRLVSHFQDNKARKAAKDKARKAAKDKARKAAKDKARKAAKDRSLACKRSVLP